MPSYGNKIPIEVSTEYPLYQSKRGNYFIGQTPILINKNNISIVTLRNPIDSNRSIYLNAITITNISSFVLSAEFYLRSTFHYGITSNLVNCTNTEFSNSILPKGKIKYLNNAINSVINGVNIFTRIVSSNSTLVVDGSQIILAPGEAMVICIKATSLNPLSEIRVAFGWWEEHLNNTTYKY